MTVSSRQTLLALKKNWGQNSETSFQSGGVAPGTQKFGRVLGGFLVWFFVEKRVPHALMAESSRVGGRWASFFFCRHCFLNQIASSRWWFLGPQLPRNHTLAVLLSCPPVSLSKKRWSKGNNIWLILLFELSKRQPSRDRFWAVLFRSCFSWVFEVLFYNCW